VTAALFSIGKLAIGLYLGRSSVGSAYGAAGSFVVLLLWVYYSALVFFFGAEITEAYANVRRPRLDSSRSGESLPQHGP
jgi:membrane protein